MEPKMKEITIFIFRRDLRLKDNTGLINCMKKNCNIVPIFIFDPRQTCEHDYFSKKGFAFLLESLTNLDEELIKNDSKLHVYEGLPIEVLKEISKNYNIVNIAFNSDYTPFSTIRDNEINDYCKSNNIDLNTYHDLLINPPGSILKKDGTPYVVYTPFKNRSLEINVNKPSEEKTKNLIRIKEGKKELISNFAKKFDLIILNINHRKDALKILDNLPLNYHKERDYPELDSTTKLSKYHKFGNVSIRESYYKAKKLSLDTLISELYWRDFYMHICYYHPKVLKESFNSKYNKVKWVQDNKMLELWKIGSTGFPIIDAGMRELNASGYMHNRVRMIVASFLTKHLMIHWKEGEKYFATKLVDYDPANNNGGWQWSASTGCDAQPYFRIFNPWLQQKKFDKDTKYIKKWVKELKNINPNEIHKEDSLTRIRDGYPKPILIHSEQRKITIEKFKEALS